MNPYIALALLSVMDCKFQNYPKEPKVEDCIQHVLDRNHFIMNQKKKAILHRRKMKRATKLK